MNNSSPFPWQFYIRLLRVLIVPILISILGTLLLYKYHLGNAEKLRALDKVSEVENILRFNKDLTCEQLHELEVISLNKNCQSHLENKTQGMFFPENELHPTVIESKNITFYKSSIGSASYLLYFQQQQLNQTYQKIDIGLFLIILPLSLALMAIMLYLVLLNSKPFMALLNKVSEVESELSHSRRLKLFYEKNEWDEIETILNSTERSLETQLTAAKIEYEKISTLLESISESIIAIDNEENILYSNTNFRRTFPHKDQAVKNTQDIFKENSKILRNLKKALTRGQVRKVSSYKIIIAGTKHYFDIKISPIKDPQGRVIGAVGIFHDISELKLTEQMRVDFVANVSHEIRTPLTSIKGFTQLLQEHEKKIDPTLHDFIDKIVFNTERLISLFNDLLNLSVIESQYQINLEPFELSPMVEKIKASLLPTYQAKNLSFEIDLQVQELFADSKLMEQVFTNLMDNACKYTFENSTIKFSSFMKDESTILSISDNGPGIGKQHIDRIFERFYRVEGSRDRATGGTGLGLSIVKHIMSRHKGRVWAESEKNHGTIFFVELPNLEDT